MLRRAVEVSLVGVFAGTVALGSACGGSTGSRSSGSDGGSASRSSGGSSGGGSVAGRIWGHIDCPDAMSSGQMMARADGGAMEASCPASADFLFEQCLE
jgi:hypothetical protein